VRTRNIALTLALSLASASCAASAPVATPTPDDMPAVPTPAGAPATSPPPTPAAPATPTPQPATVAPATAEPVTPTPEPAEPEGVSVTIVDLGYQPATLEVNSGMTVTWTNSGVLPHTVTFQEGSSSGTLDTGATFERTFDTTGSFSYTCAFHPTMTGTINVSD